MRPCLKIQRERGEGQRHTEKETGRNGETDTQKDRETER